MQVFLCFVLKSIDFVNIFGYNVNIEQIQEVMIVKRFDELFNQYIVRAKKTAKSEIVTYHVRGFDEKNAIEIFKLNHPEYKKIVFVAEVKKVEQK